MPGWARSLLPEFYVIFEEKGLSYYLGKVISYPEGYLSGQEQ
jgi:hypothetical protein